MARTRSIAQWESIPPDQWNKYQIRAAETHGIDTPGNRLTVLGASATALGLFAIKNDQIALGTALIVAGRGLDVKDGKKAAETGTIGSERNTQPDNYKRSARHVWRLPCPPCVAAHNGQARTLLACTTPVRLSIDHSNHLRSAGRPEHRCVVQRS